MPNYVGMNAWEIRQLARAMNQAANDLAGAARSATQEIGAVDWRGPDRDNFVQLWNSQHAHALNTASAGLRDAAREALRSAEAQERASAD